LIQKKERIRRYRRCVYEAGSLKQLEKGNIKVIADKALEKERSRESYIFMGAYLSRVSLLYRRGFRNLWIKFVDTGRP